MRYVALKTVMSQRKALEMMREGWHLASAAREDGGWAFLMGRPDVHLNYDPDTDTYNHD